MKRIVFFIILAIILMIVFISCMSPAEPPRYTVIFNLDGGHLNDRPHSLSLFVTHGDSINRYNNIPDNPQKEFYIFGGWFTAKNGFGNEITADTRIFSNVTAYAKWILE